MRQIVQSTWCVIVSNCSLIHLSIVCLYLINKSHSVYMFVYTLCVTIYYMYLSSSFSQHCETCCTLSRTPALSKWHLYHICARDLYKTWESIILSSERCAYTITTLPFQCTNMFRFNKCSFAALSKINNPMMRVLFKCPSMHAESVCVNVLLQLFR